MGTRKSASFSGECSQAASSCTHFPDSAGDIETLHTLYQVCKIQKKENQCCLPGLNSQYGWSHPLTSLFIVVFVGETVLLSVYEYLKAV